jgi:hypothetical protein
VTLLITCASGVLDSKLVRLALDAGRAAGLGIRLRAPADLLRRVVTEAP